MKVIAAIDADLKQTPLGTRSRLSEPIGGVPVLRRTVERLGHCENLKDVIVTFPEAQGAEIQTLLEGTKATLRSRPERRPPYQALVRAARKWSLNGWRGGIGGSCVFDEYTDTELLVVLARDVKADAVVVVAPGAALIDPALVDGMVTHFERTSEEMRMTFAQTPPGLSPAIFHRDLLAQLAENRIPPGWTLAYKPDNPATDLAMRTCCFTVGQGLRHASGRVTADTSRSLEVMRRIVEEGADRDAETAGRWLIDYGRSALERLPREVEIELTTDDPLPVSLLRPRGERVPQREPISLELVGRLAQELASEDDTLVVLGGHGDPVLHSQFAEIVATLREAGVFGIAVSTTGQRLADDAIAAMIRHRVDVVTFQVDAWTPELYARLTGGGDLDNARSAIARVEAARQRAGQPEPIIVPQMIKCLENLEELDPFFDGWVRKAGWATVIGYSHYGGRLPDRSAMDMSPPTRVACRRLSRRCVVLADGTVTPCDQDFGADLATGQLGQAKLEQVWSGEAYQRLRASHFDGRFDSCRLCAGCAEWHRP